MGFFILPEKNGSKPAGDSWDKYPLMAQKYSVLDFWIIKGRACR